MKQALIVIDMINDIVAEKGALASCADYCEKHPVIANINKVIRHFRDKDRVVLFVKVGFQADYADCPKDWQELLQKKKGLQLDTWGTEIISAIDFDRSKDKVITKARVSPFYKTKMESLLKELEVQEVIVTGVATNNAVDLFAREAWDRDFSAVVLEDACGAATAEIHEATLVSLPPVIKIQKVNEFINVNN